MVEVQATDDLAEAIAVLEPLLLDDPVANNLVLSLLDQLQRRPGVARAWWVSRSDRPPMVGLQTEPWRPVAIVGEDPAAVEPLASAIADDGVDLPGVNAEIRLAAAFAGAWAARRKVPASVEVTQRYYRLDALTPAAPIHGQLRLAVDDDMTVIEPWAVGFQREALGGGQIDTATLFDEIRWKIDQNEVWVWETDQPVAMSAATRPVAGVSRIQHVYTPPENRNRGFAAAVVSGQVGELLAAGVEHCVLFTDLANPTSNGLYQRLGFEPACECANIRFGPR